MLLTWQKTVLKDNHRFRVLKCGRRAGKTSLAAKEIKGLSISRESRIAYIANNYQQARDIMWELLKKELQGATLSTNEQRLEIKVRTIDGKESLVVLRGWESVDNLRGQAFDFLVLDEVAMMRNFWVNWREVLRPTLTDRKGSVLFCSTPKGFNHFYDLYNEELKDKDFKSFHFTSYDNESLPVDELESAKQSLPKDTFAQEYLADFKKTQGLVYKEFDRAKHLYSKLDQHNFKKVVGVDFGFTNPAGVLDIRTNGERFYVENEWKQSHRTEEQVADYVKALKPEEVYPDPENPSAIEVLKSKSLNVREVLKGKDSVSSGIQRVRELLLQGKIRVNEQCVNLIAEFEMYSYEDEETDKNKPEKPIKANDHLLDALRYVVTMVQKVEQLDQFKINLHERTENSTR